MDPRPIPMARATIHTAAVTTHPTMTTASDPQTDLGQMTMVLAIPIRTAAVTGRQTTTATDRQTTTTTTVTDRRTKIATDRQTTTTVTDRQTKTAMDRRTTTTTIAMDRQTTTTTATDQITIHTGQGTVVLAMTIHTEAATDHPAKPTTMGHPTEKIMDPVTNKTMLTRALV